jgi:hypothetical protein
MWSQGDTFNVVQHISAGVATQRVGASTRRSPIVGQPEAGNSERERGSVFANWRLGGVAR